MVDRESIKLMTWYLKSAITGLLRMGADPLSISLIFEVDIKVVEKIWKELKWENSNAG